MKSFFLACAAAFLALSTWDLLMSDDRLRQKVWSPISAVFGLARKIVGWLFIFFVCVILMTAFGFEKVRPKLD